MYGDKKEEEYIYKTISGTYKVYKNPVYAGTYKTLEEARKVRDYCKEHNWKVDTVKRRPNPHYNKLLKLKEKIDEGGEFYVS